VDGTLEVSAGPVRLDVLRSFKAKGDLIYIIGNYGKLAQTTTEFADGNIGVGKEDSLRKLGEKHPEQAERIYVGDVESDRAAAERAGWKFVFASDFAASYQFGRDSAGFQLGLSRVVLAVCLNLSSLFDYYTTKKALEAGLKEGNPFARTIMRAGWRKYQAVKFCVPAAWSAMALASNDPSQMWTVSMALGTVAFLYAAINNIFRMRV